GRVPTAKRKSDEIKTLIAEGLKPHQIAAQLNIGVASVYRYR
ncbi:MAG: helix-turn-helix domain-containing protein, partial [Marinovum sp.]|nr:helix-turn-helix domain-containing protein [Marinovum sp.]